MRAADVPLVPGPTGRSVERRCEPLARGDRLPGAVEGGRRRRWQGHATRRRATASSTPPSRRRAAEADAAFADGALYLEKAHRARAPRRDPGALRQPRRRADARRARVLDPAPSPEADRGVAVARRHGRRRGRSWRRPSSGPVAASDTRARGPSSSSSARMVGRTSSRSTAGSRSSIPSRSWSPGSTSSASRSGSRQESRWRSPVGRLAMVTRSRSASTRRIPRATSRPSPGTITRFRPPLGPGVRVDTAVADGGEIPPYYDSMIAKVIVYDDRPARAHRPHPSRAGGAGASRACPTTQALALDILAAAVRGRRLHHRLPRRMTDVFPSLRRPCNPLPA